MISCRLPLCVDVLEVGGPRLGGQDSPGNKAKTSRQFCPLRLDRPPQQSPVPSYQTSIGT